MEKHHSDLFQEKARELLGQKSVLPPEQYYALIESFLKDVCERYENRDLNRIVYALDASNEGIWDYQVTSGKMYMNNRWYTMLGYEPGELPASMNTFRRLCHVQDMLKNIKYISKVLLSGESTYEVDLRMKEKNGNWRWVRNKGRVVERNSFGLVTRIVGTNTDIHDLKSNEQAAAESNERYKLLAESTSEGILFADNGIITEANNQLAEMLNCGEEKIIGKGILNLFSEEWHDVLTSIFSKNETLKGYPVQLLSTEGSIHAEMAVRPVSKRGKKGMVVIFTDIRERIRTEQLLKENEERYKILTDASFEGIGITHNGVVTDINEQMLEMLGMQSRDEIIGKTMFESIAPESWEIVKMNVQNNHTEPYRVTLIRKDGSKLYAEANGRKYQYKGKEYRISSLKDISFKMKVEKELMESEERYRVLFENSITPILLTTLDGKAVAGNRNFYNISGYTLEELQKQNVMDFYKNPLERHKFVTTLRQKGKVEGFELELILKDRVATTLVNSTMLNINGNMYILSNYLDITQRKRIDDAIKRIYTGISGTTGRQVINQMTEILADVLGADMAFIGEFRDKTFVDVVSGFMLGTIINDFSFPIQETPCRNVLSGNPCVIRDGLSNEFKFGKLPNPGYNCYMGVPLVDIQGNIIGVMATFYVKPVSESDLFLQILQVFALRAASELLRMKSDNALLKSETMYRNTIEYSPVGVCLSDMQSKLVFMNSQFCEFLGYKENELHGVALDQMARNDYQNTEGHLFAQLLSNRIPVYSIEKIYIRKDRKEVWGKLTVSLIRDMNGDPQFINAIVEDITRKKQIEEEIINSMNRFHTLFDYSPIAIWEQDLSSAKPILDKLGWSLGLVEKFVTKNTTLLRQKPRIKILDMNQSAKELFKVSTIEEFSEHMPRFVSESTMIQMFHVCKMFLSGQTKVIIDQNTFDAEGKPLQLSVQYAIPKGYEDTWSRVIVTAVDIAHHLETERKMLNAVIETEERERSRIARDIHDELGPFLSGIKLYINELGRNDLQSPRRKALAVYLNQMIDESINKTKLISYELMPNVLKDFGLIKAIESFCTKLNQISKVDIELKANSSMVNLPANHDIIIYRVVIELLNNTLKHADATKASITMNETKRKLAIVYTDNGKGFDVPESLKNSQGFGLQNILHRINSIGGVIEFHSRKNKGLKAEISIPISRDKVK